MSLKFKRNYLLVVLLVVITTLLTAGIGDQKIIAYTVKSAKTYVQTNSNYASAVNLFDDSVVHSIQVIIDEDDYQTMITTYQTTGEKDYFHAEVIIDGVQVSNVGIRLKGNASLRTALGRNGRNGMQNPGQRNDDPLNNNRPPFNPGNNQQRTFQNQQDGAAPDQQNDPVPTQQPGAMLDQSDNSMPTRQPGANFDRQNNQLPEQQPGQQMPGDGNRQQQADDPAAGQETSAEQTVSITTKIPFLIKFDEYVSGQTYQGYSRLAIRTYGTTNDVSMMQEPVTNSIAHLIGLPATQTAFTGFHINDNPEQLYIISEVIDKTYLSHYFAYADGVLYKAEIGATLDYQGDDPSAYAKSFTQQTRENDADMGPLIEFIKFISESDDATFEKELPVHFDVDSFATYLAYNNMVVNLDSVGGMNNNYYLYYDEISQKFTLLMWDANESLGKLGGRNQSPSYDLYYQGQQGGFMRMGGGSNILMKRFLANPTFTALYEEKLETIYQQIYASGALSTQVETYAAMVRQANQERNLVNSASYEQAVSDVLKFISQRNNYLATTPLLGTLTKQSTDGSNTP